MVFSSLLFLQYFLPIALLVITMTPRRFQAYAITGMSLLFAAWWRPDFVCVMLFSIIFDFYAGRAIAASESKSKRRAILLASCIVNFGLLGFFKYANFGIDSLNEISKQLGHPIDLKLLDLILPMGISFYTFQSMSYTIDVYRGEVQPVRRPIDFMACVSMFPHQVAGPIVRFRDLAAQLETRRQTESMFFQGILSLQSGLIKKLLIADIVAPLATQAFGALTGLDGTPATGLGFADSWIGILAYTFQIYFDFSGYSDMAIGLGLMLGFRFPENFNRPYASASITEFWRRWHITLSTWLRDYLYLPLGGNRRGPLRTYVNLMLTMLLGGLWHGANWTFVAWGLYQGFWLVVERALGKRPLLGRAPRVVQVAFTFVLVMIGWVFFRAEKLRIANQYLVAMSGLSSGGPVTGVVEMHTGHVVALVAGAAVIWLCPTTQTLCEKLRPAWVIAIQILFAIGIAHLYFASHVPFLYFQF